MSNRLLSKYNHGNDIHEPQKQLNQWYTQLCSRLITIKLKTIVSRWNDEFKLLDGSYSVSDIQDYIKHIKKELMKH